MDLQTALTPVVVGLITVLVFISKRWIPSRWSVLYPVLATSLGPVADLMLSMATSKAASPGRGLLMGLAAVAVRELVDQTRKARTKIRMRTATRGRRGGW